MARVSIGTRLLYRTAERRFPRFVAFPRWIMAALILIIGFLLWIGVLSDPSGKQRAPSLGSICYVVAVIGVTTFLAYSDRDRDSTGKNRKVRPEYKGRRHATAK